MSQAAQDLYQDSYDEEWLYPKSKGQDRWPKKLAFKEPHTSERHRDQKRRKPPFNRQRDN